MSTNTDSLTSSAQGANQLCQYGSDFLIREPAETYHAKASEYLTSHQPVALPSGSSVKRHRV